MLYFGLETILGLGKMLLINNSPPINKIDFLLAYRLSQDHLELFFSKIRSRFGFNPNPTCRNFTAAFKCILMQSEIKIDSGNCSIIQEKLNTKCKYVKSYIYKFYIVVNFSSSKSSFKWPDQSTRKRNWWWDWSWKIDDADVHWL